MAIDVLLKVKNSDVMLGHLNQSPGMALRIKEMDLDAELLYIDVFSLAVEEDIHGDIETLSQEENDFLSKFSELHVFLPEDLSLPELTALGGEGYGTNLIGTWNANFLRWIKFISMETKEEILVIYDHERGDLPYESACWSFNYTHDSIEVEHFWIEDYDGLQWEATLRKLRNGDIQKEFISHEKHP